MQVNHTGTSDITTVTSPGAQPTVSTATTTESTDPVRIAQLAHAMLQQSAASKKGTTGPSRQGLNVRLLAHCHSSQPEAMQSMP